MIATVFTAQPTTFTPWGRPTTLPKEEAKIKVADLLRIQGYRVNLGKQGQNCLWVTNKKRVACVEVRLAKFTPNKARHQASVQTKQPVDLLILMLRDKTANYYPYVLPLSVIGNRYNVSIWEENPVNYTGRWAKYMNAWEHLHQAVSQAPPRDQWHLSLFR